MDCNELDIFAELSNMFLVKWLEFSNERGRKRCATGNRRTWHDITNEELAGYVSIVQHMQIKVLPEVKQIGVGKLHPNDSKINKVHCYSRSCIGLVENWGLMKLRGP